MKITYPQNRGNAPLFCQYRGQYNPQNTYLELYRGEARLDYNSEIGSGVPGYIWNHEGVRFDVSCDLSFNQCKRMSVDAELIELLVKWSDSETSEDSQRNDNEDRNDLEIEIQKYLDDNYNHTEELAQVLSSDAYLGELEDTEIINKGESISDCAARLEVEAERKGITLTGDLEKYLKNRFET